MGWWRNERQRERERERERQRETERDRERQRDRDRDRQKQGTFVIILQPSCLPRTILTAFERLCRYPISLHEAHLVLLVSTS